MDTTTFRSLFSCIIYDITDDKNDDDDDDDENNEDDDDGGGDDDGGDDRDNDDNDDEGGDGLTFHISVSCISTVLASAPLAGYCDGPTSDNCYLIYEQDNNNKSWDQADEACRKLNQRLATVPDENIQVGKPIALAFYTGTSARTYTHTHTHTHTRKDTHTIDN